MSIDVIQEGAYHTGAGARRRLRSNTFEISDACEPSSGIYMGEDGARKTLFLLVAYAVLIALIAGCWLEKREVLLH